MNVWGKVFAVLVVLAGLVNTFLTAKLIQVRNSYAAKARGFEQKYQDLQSKQREVQRLEESLRRELESTERAWGASWLAQTVILNPNMGQLAVELGSNHRLEVGRMLYGFEILPDGRTEYRGEFVLTDVQPTQSALQATWLVRNDDIRTWQPGRWRWRTLIPSGYTQVSDVQLSRFQLLYDTLNDRASVLRTHQGLIASLQQQRELRRAEIMGGPGLESSEALEPEFRQGLLKTLVEVEEQRNQLLAINRDLRVRVRAARDHILQLEQQNRKLFEQLPTGRTEVTLVPKTGS
ncbi:MAG: hypothetical protein KatS3mg114_0714 [Planctomycetaceae bacterium]|nr:MAG: hypothetical protein KatS3mg114_0714 [Planctomycetaceae bacterium]